MAALVPDFAEPPGNITGLTLTSRQQREKCLQLFKEAVPGIRRVGVLFNPLNPVWQRLSGGAERRRASLGDRAGAGRGAWPRRNRPSIRGDG